MSLIDSIKKHVNISLDHLSFLEGKLSKVNSVDEAVKIMTKDGMMLISNELVERIKTDFKPKKTNTKEIGL